jgi:hypothetical protein
MSNKNIEKKYQLLDDVHRVGATPTIAKIKELKEFGLDWEEQGKLGASWNKVITDPEECSSLTAIIFDAGISPKEALSANLKEIFKGLTDFLANAGLLLT